MSDVREQYDTFRDSRTVLLNAAAQRIPVASMAAQGRALGLWRHNRVEPGTEMQLSCVMDLGVFSPVGGQKPALERLVGAATPPPGSTDETMLAAFQRARFSWWRLGEKDPRGGLSVQDVLSGETLWLMDSFIGEQGLAGAVMAARVVVPGDFALTCGTFAPLDFPALLAVLQAQAPLDGPVPVAPRFNPGDPRVAALLAEAAVPARLAQLAADPLWPARSYRAALDHGLLGPVPGR